MSKEGAVMKMEEEGDDEEVENFDKFLRSVIVGWCNNGSEQQWKSQE
jgi:hypothetical protein